MSRTTFSTDRFGSTASSPPSGNGRFLREAAIDHRQTMAAFPIPDQWSREPIGRFRLSGLQQPVREPRAPHGRVESSRRVHEAGAIGFAKRISPRSLPAAGP
jgi:hypothetical protein